MRVTIHGTADATGSDAGVRVDLDPHDANPTTVLEVEAGQSGPLSAELTSANDKLVLARPAHGEPVTVTGTAEIDNTEGEKSVALELRRKEPGTPLQVTPLVVVEAGQTGSVDFTLAVWSDELRVVEVAT